MTAFADIFHCPNSGAPLEVEERNGDVALRCPDGHSFPVVDGIPRFVSESFYTQSFGRQWNRWATNQVDSLNGTTIFRDRFSRYLCPPEDLRGMRVLDAGCGAGAFIDVTAPHASEVVAFDLSTSVEAARRTFEHHEHVTIAQADLLEPPLAKHSFDFVYCIGVLQHTPDPERAFASIAELVRPGGRLGVWIYERAPWEAIKPRHLLRRYTKALSGPRAERFVEQYAPPALKARRALSRLPGGSRMKKLVPVADVTDYAGRPAEQLDDHQIAEWCVMDTHDMLVTTYDSPQRPETVSDWFEANGFSWRRSPAEALAFIGQRES
jgi:SAM-dependent methyltransferase